MRRGLEALLVLGGLLMSARTDLLAAPPGVGERTGPRVLLMMAHPDDESVCAASLYMITQEQGGVVDLAVITNGEGGFRHSYLAGRYHGLALSEEAVGREHLPAIRKQELMAGGRHVGVRNYFFLDERDHEYTRDVDVVLREVWEVVRVKAWIQRLVERGGYDWIFCMLPTPETHGHHQAATILALRAVSELPMDERPGVLAVGETGVSDAADSFVGLEGHAITRIAGAEPVGVVDRTRKVRDGSRLDYRVVVNWLIAEHRSQGSLQLLMNKGETETFWSFELNGRSRTDAAEELIESLNRGPTTAGGGD